MGGTRGIGRGVAVALAQQGTSVTNVGRHNGAETVALLRTHARKGAASTPQMEFVAADLSTVQGVLDLATQLHLSHGQFDDVVMTINQFPNPLHPRTLDGHDRSVGIGVVARFTLLRRLIETRLLAHGARVLSICASTKTDVPAPSWEIMQRILNKELAFDGSIGSFLQSMGTMSLVHDAMIQIMAKKYKGVSIIGMHPGFVVTDLMQNTIVPAWAIPLVQVLMRPVSRSEESIGQIVVEILASTNIGNVEQLHALGAGGRKGKYMYFNSLGEGRKSQRRAYNESMHQWLEKEWFDLIYETMVAGGGKKLAQGSFHVAVVAVTATLELLLPGTCHACLKPRVYRVMNIKGGNLECGPRRW